jgi:hypothetical protein
MVSDGGNQFLNRHRPRQYTHIELVRSIRERDRARLSDWEKRFLASITQFANPTPKQMEVLKVICAEAVLKRSKRTAARQAKVVLVKNGAAVTVTRAPR